VVRHDIHKHHDDNPDTKSNGRDRGAGLSLLEVGTPRCGVRTAQRAVPTRQPKGRFNFILATSVRSTHAALASRRLRFALFVDIRWRREERVLKTLPRAVILKRFATAFRVLLRATDFGIRRES
jgi:hypothetical protein